MRIGMMADAYKPHVSGITHYIELNKRYLEAAGHEVYVFTFGGEENVDEEPHVIRSPGIPLADTGYYLSLRYTPQARRLLQTMDVVHLHHPFLSGRLALKYCRPLRIPIVFTNHTRYDLYAQAYVPFLPEEMSESFLRTYLPAFCEAVDEVISPSAGVAQVLRDLGVKVPIEIVPNGVELKRFHEAQPLPRAEFGFDQTDILLVYAGRIAPEKNLNFLLQAFAGVARALPNVYLFLIGGGQKQWENEITRWIGELGIGERVRWTGIIPYERLPAYLAMCDAFVTASVTEVHPLSVIEAMGSGLPVVGIQSPGVGDTVIHEVTGFLSTHDLPSYTAYLMRMVLEEDHRRKMGLHARRESEKYDIQRTSRIMLEHYTRLVTASRPAQLDWRVRLRALWERLRQ
uniref:Glycosyl transferase family 1 n=1 Tax=uncultured Chloroflexota bacterium TaxID=166587 RepID=H5SF32_9CHLR|nr:glycosyl transferase family 1 [uncultured Chloroflexota bacterium]